MSHRSFYGGGFEAVRTCIIFNPNAGTADQIEVLKELTAQSSDIVLWESRDSSHIDELVIRGVEEGFDIIAAAGGDGTVNAVVNSIMNAGRRPRFGLVPLGTGNDLARTLDISLDPRDAVALLEAGQVIDLDLIKVDADGKTVYAVNAAAGGFSGQVNEVLTPELKERWGPLAYIIGAVTTFPEIQSLKTRVTFDSGQVEEMNAFNIIVANGRTVAGGKRVAPMANPSDGKLDVVIVKWDTAPKMAEVGARLLTGNYVDSENVVHRAVSKVQVSSKPGMWFNVDGELLTNSPITFTCVPGAIECVVGNDFQAEAVL